MELHLKDTNFISYDNSRGIAWCDEGVLIIDGNNSNMDLLINNRIVYVGTAEATDDDKLVFSCRQIMEE
jgi:hypothetical protein